jgi:TonB family protein
VDRSAQARTLVRRLVRRDDVERRRWAVIGAVWAHLGLVGALAMVPWARPADEQAPERVELVVLVDAEEAPALPTAPTPNPAPREGDPRRASAPPGPIEPVTAPTAPEPEAAGPPMERRARAVVSGDPVSQLRAELGWAAFDRSALPERAATLSLVAGSGAVSPSGGFDDAEVSFRPASELEGSALGPYVDDLERRVMDRWSAMELDIQARALGIQGDVTVRYRIRRSGATADVRVARSSGLPALDGMAIRAIPARVGRLPAAFEGEELHHEVTLRYRNP